MSTTRRAFLASVTASLASGPLHAALRLPRGGTLRLPLPGVRRVSLPSLAVDLADTWPLALLHEGLATAQPDGTATYPLLASPPAVDRGDPRVVTLALRPGVAFSN